MSFNPAEHMIQFKGRDYLEVKWRLVWFREANPTDSGWGIRTIAEHVTDDSARYRAQIIDPQGRVIAEGTKTEDKRGFADFVEKAETGAIGRALALCGYGTQFTADELDEGQRIVDSPVTRNGSLQPDFDPAKPTAVQPLQPARTANVSKAEAEQFKRVAADNGLGQEQIKEAMAALGITPSQIIRPQMDTLWRWLRQTAGTGYVGPEFDAEGRPILETEEATV